MTWSRDFSFPLVICLVLIVTTISNSQVITGVRPSTPSQATASRISALCPTGWLPASVPKPGYDLITNQLCLKLNLPERRWADAVDQCRMSRGFMVKLDSIVMVKETPLFDYLRQRDVSSVWSGMHHKYGTLLWDDLHPKMVKVYIGENEPYGWRKRGYAFDQSSYVLGDKTCGYLTLTTNQTSKSNKLDRRLRRSPGDLTVRPSEVPKPKDKAQPDKPVNLHVDHDDSPSKAQPTSGQKKTATPRVLLNTTTQSTTTDQSDQEDNEHPGPTTLHPPFPGETTSKPTTPQKQSAKGTSLPSSTLALTTAEPFGFPSLIDTLYNPSSDMSLDSSPLSDFGTQEEVQVGRKDKRIEVAFDTKIPNARLPKGANSSESIESKEQVSPSWLKSVTNFKQNSTSVASPVTTVNHTQASTTPSTASKPITMASTLDKATIKLSQSLDITTAAISTSTTTAPSNAEVQTTKSTKALETTTTDSESSKENSDSSSNESGTTVNSTMASLANIQNSTADQTTGPTSWTTTYADTSKPVETTNLTTTTATTTQSTDSITTTTEAISTLTQTTELTKPPQALESTTTPPTQNPEATTSQQAQDSINKPTQTQDSSTSTQNQTSITTPAQASEHLTLNQTSKASEAVESTTRASTTTESVLLSSFTGTVQNDSLSASIKQNLTASTETIPNPKKMSNMSKGEVSSSAESQDSSQEQVATLDDDIFPMQSYLNLLLPSTRQQQQIPSTTGSPSSSTDSQESSEERDFFTAMRATMPAPPADVMSLGDCNEEKASLCFTEAIDQLSLVSHCERNWYGHRLLDRCYKPLTISVTEMEAKQQCLRQSGSLAAGDTDFYGNVTAILQDMLVANKMAGKRIWLDTSLNLESPGGNGLCSALENGQISRVSCSSRLAVICQKDAQFVRTLEDFRDKLEAITYIQNMTSFQPQTLPCPLGMTAFDDVIVWFKDGRPIDDLKDDDSTSFGPKNGQLPNSLELDLSILKRIGETSPVYLKPPMLQGEYWCEIWRKAPFRRIPSNKIYIKFTDVITLRGVIFTEPISYTDAAIFNRMGQKVGVPAAMEMRLSIMNKNITNYLRGILPIIRDVITSIKSVSADEGQSEFVTYISTSTGDLPPHMRGNVADLYLSAFFEALVLNEDVIRTEWNLTLPLIRAVSVSMTDLCPEKTLVDPKTNFSATFPSTPVNTQTYSRDYCNNAYSGNAYCKGNLQTGAYWDSWTISQSCLLLNVSAPVPGSALNGPTNGRVTNTSADGASTKLPNVITVPDSAMLDPDSVKPLVDDVSTSVDLLTQVLNQTTNLTDLDIHTVAHLVNNIASVNVPPREVGQMLIQTVNKILDAPPEVLLKAEEESHAPSRMLANLEQFGAKVDMEGQTRLRYVTPNVAMELWNLQNSNDVVIGFGATETNSWSEPLEEPRIVTIKNRTWSEQNLPGFDVAIELPESLVRNTVKHSQRDLDKALRLTMFLYRKTSAFLSLSPGETPSGDINSAIISASLGERRIEGLDEKVRLVFKPFKETKNREQKTKCVFWDTETSESPAWSTKGCTYNGTLNGRDVCLCDHLTNFAILLDFYGDEKSQGVSAANETSLNVLTLIGVSLSIFGLAITIITFLAFKKLRQGRAQQTLFNMAIALLCFQTTFLVGVKQTSIKSVCLTVSVLLHYFILVSFAWMLIEAVLQYLTFVKVLGTYISKYTLKTVLSAWGFPLIPVVAVLATDYNLYYGRANYCWMNLYAFYYAFALPVGIIIVFNSIMFFIIIISLITRPKGLRSNQSNNKTRETNLKAAFTIFVLLGLTWLFGYFAIEDARAVFQYAFTILSSMQGFLIFILMVVRRKQVRDLWRAACCERRQTQKSKQKKQLSPTSSSSMSSSNSLSNSNRTLPSFINHAYDVGALVLRPELRRENSVSI